MNTENQIAEAFSDIGPDYLVPYILKIHKLKGFLGD
jgi:hypothetical protein